MQAAHNCVYKLDPVFRVIFVGCWLQLQPRMRFYPMQYLSSVFSKFYRDYLLMRRWCVLGSAVKMTGQCLNWWIIVSSCSRSVSCQHWPPVWMLHQSLQQHGNTHFRVTSFLNLLFTSFLIPFGQPKEHFDKTRPHLFFKENIYFSIFLYKAQRECCYCAFHKVQALGSFTVFLVHAKGS